MLIDTLLFYIAERPVVALWMTGINELVNIDPRFSVEIRKIKLGEIS